LTTRIVFLIYVDLYWPPEKNRIHNPDRFALMFAPITRTYSTSFSAQTAVPPIEPYIRNRVVFPKDVAGNLAHLYAWQKEFAGDSFDFDYHLIWDHYLDPGYMDVAQGLHRDLQALHSIGLNGYMSCQVQRAFFPTGLCMAVLAATLWDRDVGYDQVRAEHFDAAFGRDGAGCADYLEKLTRHFDPVYLRGEKSADEAVIGALADVPSLVEGFRPTIRKNLNTADPCRRESWRILEIHGELCLRLAAALRERAIGDEAGALSRWRALADWLWAQEADLHPVLDTWMFVRTVGRLFRAAEGGINIEEVTES
jgi:hypothetical protein